MDNKEFELVNAVLKKGKELYMQTGKSTRHTCISGILAESGKIYFGANCDSIHGTCAEVVAYVNTVMENEKKLLTIVTASVKGEGIERILVPCGNCRQILLENTPNINVIIHINGKLEKFPIKELLPNVYLKKEGL